MSTREEKIQLATAVDSSGALQGLKEVEAGAARMAGAVGDSAAKAGAKIDAMGDSGAQASAKLDANTRSIVASIQRATAAAEAGEKGTAKFFESLGRQRGADVNALQPYLQQLEQARQRTDGLTISTGQYTNALRMVPAQMTDIVTSLASGQDPLLVLIQQGGQLKDQFGGVGAAAKAIGGYVVGMVNPLTLSLAAAAGLALAFESGRKESALLDVTATKTAATLGVTAGQLESIVSKLSGAGLSRGAISTALTEIAANGRVAADSLERYTLFAAEVDKYTGQGVAETAKVFKELADEPTKATLKLNEALGYLTQSQYEQIKSLEEQGRKTEAARIAQAAYADAVKPTIEAYKANMGALEKAMDFWAQKGKSMWDAITGIGRSDTGEERIAAARAKLEQMRTRGGGFGQSAADRKAMIQAAQDELTYLERVTQAVRDNAAAEAKRQATQRAGIEASSAVESAQNKGLGKQQQLNKALDDYREGLDKIRAANPESALLNPERVAAGEKAIREQFKDTAAARVNAENMQIAALRSKAVAEEEALRRLQVYGLQADKMTDGEREVLRLQEQIAVATDGRTKTVLQAELAEARRVATAQRAQVVLRDSLQLQRDQVDLGDKQLAAIYQDTASIERKAMALEAENEAWGKSRVAIEAAVLARMQANAADVALFDGSAQVVAALNAKTDAQRRYVEALQAAELKTFNQRGDEMLRQAQELRDTYADELQLVGLSAVERDKIVAVRQVELKYAKLIADVERSSLSDAEKRAQVGKLVEAQGIESSAVVNRVMQQDFARTAAQIEQSLTDALMRGFESGKGFGENLRDTLVNMFKTLVLRPVIQATVQGGLNAIGLGAPAGAGGALNTVSNLNSLFNTGSKLASWLGLGAATGTGLVASAGTGMALASTGAGLGLTASMGTGLGLAGAGTGLGLTASAGTGTALTAGAGAAAGGAGVMSSLAAAAPWLLGGLAVVSLLKGLDDSGTMHTGGAGSYSDAQGLRSGQSVDGLDFRPSEYKEAIATGSAAFAKGLVGVLDSTAKTFGKDAGYWAATGFADDTSKDGAWGALSIMRDGKSVLDWGNGADKWPGREFKDGEKGYTEYLNAVAGDVRDLLIESTPDWADAMLEGLGDSVTMDSLSTVVAEINRTQAALTGLADTMPQLAGLSDAATTALLAAAGGVDNLAQVASSYYEAYYTEAERTATTTRQVTEAMADLGVAMPESREAFRAIVEAQDLTTESGRKTYAALLQLSPAFAEVTAAADAQRAAMLQQAGISGEGIAKALRDGLLGRMSAADVGASITDMVIGGIYNGLANNASAAISQMFVDTIVSPMLAAVTTGGNIATAVSRSSIDAVVSAANAAAQQISAVLNDPAFQAALSDIQSAIGSISGAVSGGYQAPYVSYTPSYDYGSQETAAEAAQNKWQDAFDMLSRTVEVQRTLAQEQLNAALAVYDLSRTAARDLRNEIDATREMAAREGQAFIDNAVGALQTSGYLPDEAGLREAINAARAGLDGRTYASAFEQDRDRLVLAAKLQQIADLTEPQKTAAEQQLEYLDGLLSTAQAQLDALNGVQQSTLSLTEALAAWTAAIAPASTPAPVVDPLAATKGSMADILALKMGAMGIVADSAAALAPEPSLSSAAAQLAADEQMRQLMLAMGVGGLPKFADGGLFGGGLRLVGERGPELEVTGPSRIYSAEQTRALLQGGGANTERLEAEVRALREESRAQREENRAQARALVALQTRMTKVLERWDGRGMPEERVTA